MDSCKVCRKTVDVGKAITCSGSCGMVFHFSCVGLTNSHYSAWKAKIGLVWYCATCRLNFDPAVHNREKIIMKALRELLIRTDSMDTRLGNYGENLRRVNKTLYGSQRHSNATILSDHASFLRNIDELTLDDTTDDVTNGSRSCEDTSFFEVLDEINSTLAPAPDKFTVGSNKRVQIITDHPSGSIDSSSIANVSTPGTSADHSNSSRPETLRGNTGGTGESLLNRSPTVARANPRVSGTRLRVATDSLAANDVESFYVTPFEPDQSEDGVMSYVKDISNVDTSLVKVTKLVPRGKNIEDLSFVSFKVTICKSASNVVSDPWYWPEGVSVRPFEPNQKNGSAVRLPNQQ